MGEQWVPDRDTAVAALSLLRSDLDLSDELTPNRDRMLKTVMEHLAGADDVPPSAMVGGLGRIVAGSPQEANGSWFPGD